MNTGTEISRTNKACEESINDFHAGAFGESLIFHAAALFAIFFNYRKETHSMAILFDLIL